MKTLALCIGLDLMHSIVYGHQFDLGLPVSVLATGGHGSNGSDSFTGTVPPAGAGRAVFLEVAAIHNGQLSDSNMYTLQIR